MEKQTEKRIAVIFVSQRTAEDADGYNDAAAAMDALAAKQPGYAGMVSARGEEGMGITISYWESEDAAKAWRAHPAHIAIQDQGRAHWYEHYHIDVAAISRSYDWSRHAT